MEAGTSPVQRAPRPRDGEALELEVTALAQGGRGVARTAGGFVVFVAGAIPGDRVRVRVTKSKRSYAEGSAIAILTASGDRIADRCVHGGEPCPGAAWQGMPYEMQLAAKAEQVVDALRRIGKLENFAVEPPVAAIAPWRYRNKLEYSFGVGEDGLRLGFHARGRWDEVIDVDDCLLASEENNQARNQIRDWARGGGLPAYDRAAGGGFLRNLIVREGVRTGQIQTRLVTSPASFERPPVDLHTVVEPESGSTEGPTGALGLEYLEEQLGDLRFRISPFAFFQTNTEMAERLYEVAHEYADLGGNERVFDLYCGIGTIGLSMAERAGEVWGLETNEAAVIDAEHNARLNAISTANFRSADARLGIRALLDEAGKPDLVVIDPPRSGLSQKVVRRVLECEARRIVYVSCNPTTLAPNAAQLCEAGYTLRRVRALDMFPQTPHIESVAEFVR